MEFYGILESIIEVNYIYDRNVMSFKCTSFDTNPKKKWVQRDFHFTSINVGHEWYANDPYMLLSQVEQVLYIDDPNLETNWKVIQNV